MPSPACADSNEGCDPTSCKTKKSESLCKLFVQCNLKSRQSVHAKLVRKCAGAMLVTSIKPRIIGSRTPGQPCAYSMLIAKIPLE
eukprot:5413607-Amphidinium_carterae.1